MQRPVEEEDTVDATADGERGGEELEPTSTSFSEACIIFEDANIRLGTPLTYAGSLKEKEKILNAYMHNK